MQNKVLTYTKKPRAIQTTRALALKMARLTAHIRDEIKTALEHEIPHGPLHTIFEDFKKVMGDLPIHTFADMYAQTIAYSLFSVAATHKRLDISVSTIPIPVANPFLKIFTECTGADDSNKLNLEKLGITELINLFEKTNIEAVLKDFENRKKGEDPVIHFYELFLKEYNPEQKIRRGVFYTPDAVVSFIVRSVDYLLRTEVGYPDGLADSLNSEHLNNTKESTAPLQILDPAAGTGTFLKQVIKEVKKTFDQKNKGLNEEELKKKWSEYVSTLLPRLSGFELMMAPYAVANLNVGLALAETGYDLAPDENVRIYLTNTLDVPEILPHRNSGWFADEALKASTVKTEFIPVIMGNPPYSSSSSLGTPFMNEKMKEYLTGLGVEKEKKKGALQDDYVRFIRFVHWKIDEAGKGILGFITNNSYLTGIVHRAMRSSLLKTFDTLYVLNLHGSSRIGEKTPHGDKDENVFDILQGVAIALYVKTGIPIKEKKVYYADLWGRREDKYSYLLNNDVRTVEWQEIKSESPYYFFVPKNFANQSEYEKFWKITDIFKEKSSGVETAHDHFAVAFTRAELLHRLEIFTGDLADDHVKESLNLKDLRDWKIGEARQRSKKQKVEHLIRPYAYRPFDTRWTCYDPSFIVWSKQKVMNHLVRDNLALVTVRLLSTEQFHHAFVCNTIGDRCLLSIKTKETSYIFPLYLYQNDPVSGDEPRLTNLSGEFLRAVNESFGTEVTPEDIFYYIYAILYSQKYRDRYSEFLKIDFPRIPLTSQYELFSRLSRLGGELILLHLLKSDKGDEVPLKGDGNNEVSAKRNIYEGGRLYLNSDQYFEGVPPDSYTFRIGSYHVLEKWLKERKGRTLTREDIIHFQKIITTIKKTSEIMEEIDATIEEHGGWPLS